MLDLEAEVQLRGVACLICGKADTSPVFTGAEDRFGLGGLFRVVACKECGFEWTDLPPDFDLNSWYDRGYWTTGAPEQRSGLNSPWRTTLRDAWRALNGSPRPSRWVREGRVLDVGCGPGYDTAEILDRGATALGVDMSRRALKQAAARNVPTVQATPSALPFLNDTFDVVVMSQVLEHLGDPVGALRSTRDLLRPDGTLLVLLPNAGSVQRQLFGSRWVNWHLPYHLWHFNLESTTRLLESAAFRVTRASTVSPGEWFFLSCGMRWHGFRPLNERRGISRLLRLLVVPALRMVDLFGRGDCLVVEARPS